MKSKTVKIADSPCLPRREQLCEDRCADAAFEEAIKGLVRPVKVWRVVPKKR